MLSPLSKDWPVHPHQPKSPNPSVRLPAPQPVQLLPFQLLPPTDIGALNEQADKTILGHLTEWGKRLPVHKSQEAAFIYPG